MTEKKGKYDTNPLDADYARQTEDEWGANRSDARTEEVGGATRDVARTPNEQARFDENAEAPTRRYDVPPTSASYPSVFIPPAYQQPPATSYGAATPPTAKEAPPTSRPIAGISLPENVTMILPYIPFYIGAVAAVIELLLVPRSEGRTRFHAAQGLALHLVVLGLGFVFNVVEAFTDNSLGGTLVSLAALIFFIISMIRVWKGEAHHIAPLADMTRWLNEKIKPRK